VSSTCSCQKDPVHHGIFNLSIFELHVLIVWNEVTPTTCKALMDAGYEVTVERSTQRIFDGENNVP
jgi:hypothetical protein